MSVVRRAAAVLALVAAATVIVDPCASAADSTDSTLNLHQWGAITLFHGLPSDHVRAIAQDADGVMWFGTDGGLARFDGRRTQTIWSGSIRSLARDSAGRLWVGTDAGAGRIVDGAFRPIPGTELQTIRAMASTARHTMLLASEQGELLEADEAVDSIAAVRAGPSTTPTLSTDDGPLALTSLAVRGDEVLVGTLGRGLLSVDRAFAVAEIQSRPRSFFVQDIATDSRGRLVFGAMSRADDGGAFDASEVARPKRLDAGAGSVNALGPDDEGGMWVATDEHGAIHVRSTEPADRFTFESTSGGLRSNRIYTVFVDLEGVVWFGTDRGVSRYDPRSPRVEPFGAEPDANVVRSILSDREGRTWCGTNRGLYVREGEADWRAVVSMDRRAVYALVEEADGRILAGTGNGLFAVTPKTAEAVPVAPDGDAGDGVRALAIFRGEIYAAVFGHGIAHVRHDRVEYVWPQADADPRLREVISLFDDDTRGLIVGTASVGAFVFDGTAFGADAALATLASGPIWAFDRSATGTLWIASGRGLLALDASGLRTVIDGVEARCVVAGADVVWCGTEKNGVVVVAPDGSLSSRLDAEHGLPSNAVFAIVRSDAREPIASELYVGTSRGFARYVPSVIPPRARIARVFGARAFDESEIAHGLALEYPQNGLSVEVAATNSRTYPEQFQYAFAIFDADGRTVDRRLSRDPLINLAGLRPGHYRVEARAYSNDLVASEPVELQFDVARAPFPKGVAALSLLLTIALVALWWGARQNRRLTSVNRDLRDTRLQLARETETERRRIARDLHDQTLADLRRLLLRADEEHAGGPLRSEIEAISVEIRRICEDLSPSVLANVGLTAALEWALVDGVGHLPESGRAEHVFTCDDSVEARLELDATSRIQIYRIVQEAITNACKHSGASRIELSIYLDPSGELAIDVTDDGRGLGSHDGLATGRGLANIRSRASMIGARVEWKPASGSAPAGTTFTVTIAGTSECPSPEPASPAPPTATP